MKKIILISTFLIGTTLFTSCNTSEIPQEKIEATIDLSKSSLSLNELLLIAEQIRAIEKSPNTRSNDELQQIMQPMVEVGRGLHQEMLLLINADPNSWLTPEEYADFLIFTDDQLADLAFITMSSASSSTIFRCLAIAAGIQELGNLLIGEVLTVQGAIQILKTIGKRTLGWFALAYMIYEFTECLLS